MAMALTEKPWLASMNRQEHTQRDLLTKVKATLVHRRNYQPTFVKLSLEMKQMITVGVGDLLEMRNSRCNLLFDVPEDKPSTLS